MDKFSFIALWDVYGGLLTDVQSEITDMYFNLDLTVSEIAAEKGISRQAVSDCIKGCKKQLESYEEKLRVCEKLQNFSICENAFYSKVAAWAENFKRLHPELKSDVWELEKILGSQYIRDGSDRSN